MNPRTRAPLQGEWGCYRTGRGSSTHRISTRHCSGACLRGWPVLPSVATAAFGAPGVPGGSYRHGRRKIGCRDGNAPGSTANDRVRVGARSKHDPQPTTMQCARPAPLRVCHPASNRSLAAFVAVTGGTRGPEQPTCQPGERNRPSQQLSVVYYSIS